MILEPKKIIPLLGIEHGMTVLDIGSGIGFWVKPLVDIVGVSGNIIAIDNHPDIIQRLNNDMREMKINHVHGIVGDLHHVSEFPIKKNSCDRIILIRMLDVIQHNSQEILEQISEFLSSRGQFIIIDSISHKKKLLEILQGFSDFELQEIPLVSERTNNYFFGVRINLLSR